MQSSPDEITWTAYESSYAENDAWQLIDVRTDEERIAQPTESVKPSEMDTERSPVFHCKTGIRAFDSYKVFKANYPDKEARYIIGALPSA